MQFGDKYKKQKNFSVETIRQRKWLATFPIFLTYKIKKCLILSLIYEFEIHGFQFDLSLEEIADLICMPTVTVKRHIQALVKDGILTSEKIGRRRTLKIGVEQ
jgi:DNA-binding MarR family transcriptional regulator